MSVTLYNFDDFSDASVSPTETNALLTNKSSGDNAYTIINNMGVTSVELVGQTQAGQYCSPPVETQIGDVIVVFTGTGNIYQQNTGSISELKTLVSTSGYGNYIGFKVAKTQDDCTRPYTSSLAYPAPLNDRIYVATFRTNSPVNRIVANGYDAIGVNTRQTISYSGSVYTKKPAVALAIYTANPPAFKNDLVQFSAEVGDGLGELNSMTYLDPGPGISSYTYAKIRTYGPTSSLRDINVESDDTSGAVGFGSLHFQ